MRPDVVDSLRLEGRVDFPLRGRNNNNKKKELHSMVSTLKPPSARRLLRLFKKYTT